MPNVYANVTELLQAGALGKGEYVVIGDVKCKVCDSWLHTSHLPNNYVIKNTGLNSKQLASAIYGYEADGLGFPDCMIDDYQALTRLSAVLMALTELKNVNAKRKDEVYHEIQASVNVLKKTLALVSKDIDELESQLRQGPF